MQFEPERRQLGYRGNRGSQLQSFVAKALAAVVASVVLIGAVAMSIVLFVIALAVLLVGGIFLWWKVRQVRKAAAARFEEFQQQFKEQARAQRDRHDGDIIEGVVIHEVRTRERSERER